MPAAFLMQQMEWREALDEAQPRADLDALDAEVSGPRSRPWHAAANCWTVRRTPPAAQQVRALMFIERFAVTSKRAWSNWDNSARMALLHSRFIAEPGPVADPHQRRIAVGIDLGTTHSLVAAVRNGMAECLPDEAGPGDPALGGALPAGGGRQIGHECCAIAGQDPENTIASVKRFMGRGLARRHRRAHKLPYAVCRANRHGGAGHGGGEKSPVEISAEILATLRYRAEDTFNDDLYGAVITVPAYFDDAQRQATKDAASWPA
jgi:hypothetical protein